MAAAGAHGPRCHRPGLQLGVGFGHHFVEAGDLDHGKALQAQRRQKLVVGRRRRHRTLGAQVEPVTLNFINAEIDAVARAMSALTGRNLVIDPRVKGTLNLSTERAVPPA